MKSLTNDEKTKLRALANKMCTILEDVSDPMHEILSDYELELACSMGLTAENAYSVQRALRHHASKGAISWWCYDAETKLFSVGLPGYDHVEMNLKCTYYLVVGLAAGRRGLTDCA